MKKLLSIGAVLMSVVMLAGVVPAFADSENGFTINDLTDPVSIHTEVQKEALANIETFNDYCDGNTELSYPEVTEISWTFDGEADGFTVYLSTNEDLSDAKEYTCAADENSVGVTNLYIGTTYYYAVETNGQRSDIHSFTTEADGPRNLCVDSITNVRDLGGWNLENGGKVRQGMIFRTGRLSGCSDEKEETRVTISEEGYDILKNDLGIKTELDIRAEGENEDITESALGSDVNYIFIPFSSIAYVDDNLESIRDIIKVFADENNYPIAFHCTIGTDRTGYIAFLINGLLGVSEEDLCRDYLFSNMALINGHRDAKRFQKHEMDRVSGMDGDTLSEKIHNYMLNIGVTEEEIQSIISIMTEE